MILRIFYHVNPVAQAAGEDGGASLLSFALTVYQIDIPLSMGEMNFFQANRLLRLRPEMRRIIAG